MDLSIFLILFQDGIVNAAIYALLALAMVLVFTVTRVIFVPIGEFVSFGALSLAAIELGRMPGTVWLLLLFGVASGIVTLWSERRALTPRIWIATLAETVVLPVAIAGLVAVLAPGKPAQIVQILLALAVTAPLGLYIYGAVYRPLAEASVLVLLIVSVALHIALVGLGLIFFGAEGSRTTPLSRASFTLGDLSLSGQAASVLVVTAILIAALYLFFGRTLIGKALQATAVNRVGARLVGISPLFSGRFAFGLAALIGTLGGILISPLTTIYYDTGFIIGLKGFVAAIIGGLVSYPVAAGAALLVGVIESFASFHASELKEVIVFMIIVPILLVRSQGALVLEDEE
ncbi:branched-chain amino acid ABC transporter permease [uncultured Enterovirga sp.]|uniref:branched-chain amino acid ABC transporter permease n=1 Tax=uncultured Enterovirga sp. TaxID=2026352 RepID=UPI0035C9CD85